MFDVRFIKKGVLHFSFRVAESLGRQSHIGTERRGDDHRATEMNPYANNNSPRESAASNNLSNPNSQNQLSHGNNIAARRFVRGHSQNSESSVHGMLAPGGNNLAAESGFSAQGPAASVPSGSLNVVLSSANVHGVSAASSVNALSGAASGNAPSGAASVNGVVFGGHSQTQSMETAKLPDVLNNPKVKTNNEVSVAAMGFGVYSLVAAFFAGLITAALIFLLLGNGNLG